MYENYPGMEKRERFLRIKACAKLAEEFVTVALPKIDFKLNTIMHNEEIDKILEVLE